MNDEAIKLAIDTKLGRAKIDKKVAISDIADRSVLLEAQKELGLR